MREKNVMVLSICVCACTYKRPDGLRAMLAGIGRQTFATMSRPALHIVIADNEGSEQTRAICEDFQRQSGIAVSYVHEPRRGISFARNACLDNIPPSCDFFASIDDDEVPESDWLERLIEAQVETGADVVQGAVYPLFAEGAPNWLVEGNFFGRPRREWPGTMPQRAEYQELDMAGTGNVLVRTQSIVPSGLRFDPQLALTGGEDTMFFRSLQAAGYRIVWAPRARVGEAIPRERATFWYRMQVEYRIGNNPLPPPIDPKKRKPLKQLRKRWNDSGPAKIVSGVGYLFRGGLTGDLKMDRVIVAGLRIAFGLGQTSRALGFKYLPYR